MCLFQDIAVLITPQHWQRWLELKRAAVQQHLECHTFPIPAKIHSNASDKSQPLGTLSTPKVIPLEWREIAVLQVVRRGGH